MGHGLPGHCQLRATKTNTYSCPVRPRPVPAHQGCLSPPQALTGPCLYPWTIEHYSELLGFIGGPFPVTESRDGQLIGARAQRSVLEGQRPPEALSPQRSPWVDKNTLGDVAIAPRTLNRTSPQPQKTGGFQPGYGGLSSVPEIK